MNNFNRIKELRVNKGMNQSELAEFLFLDKTAVSKWETYKNLPNQNILEKLCSLFGVTLDYLLGRTDEPTTPELHIPDNLKSVPMAFSGIEDLTQNDLDEISKFVDYIKSKKNKQQ